MAIRQLSETLINQIAAGDVIERPASVAKELIENALDAAATRIKTATAGGGKAPLRVTGTIVEVRDLFFATPAKLKFLKTEKAEAAAITEVVQRMAIAFPHVRFVLSRTDRTTLELPATGDDHLARMAQIVGSDFQDNAIDLDTERKGVKITGFAGVPTFNRGNSAYQYAFVNGRPVQDKLILSAICGAYAEQVPAGRYLVAVLSIRLDPALVDVNIHPAKSDVRLHGPGLVHGLIVGAIREALATGGECLSTTAPCARAAG